MKPVAQMSLGEPAAFVCTQLRNHGIKAVLSGVACVSIYSNNRIEFPAGPLAVGSEPVRAILEREFSTGRLSLLSPTDCVKDRLAAFYHSFPRQSDCLWMHNGICARVKP